MYSLTHQGYVVACLQERWGEARGDGGQAGPRLHHGVAFAPTPVAMFHVKHLRVDCHETDAEGELRPARVQRSTVHVLHHVWQIAAL